MNKDDERSAELVAQALIQRAAGALPDELRPYAQAAQNKDVECSPQPWRLGTFRDEPVILDAESCVVCYLLAPEQDGNLISAAPDLQEALRDLVEDYVRVMRDEFPHVEPEDGVYVKFARAALAMAARSAA